MSAAKETFEVTPENYYSKEADMAYLSVSQYKTFCGTRTRVGCEARGLAEAKREIERKANEAMLVGSYVDAYFSGQDEFAAFLQEHQDDVFLKTGKNKGGIKALFVEANEMINRARRDPLWMEFSKGDTQAIYIGEIGGVLFKCKMDVVHPERTVDIKTCRTLDTFGRGILTRTVEGEWVPFIYDLGYDIQAAVYQEIRAQNDGGVKKPFYLNCISKDKDPMDGSFHPMVATIEIPQMVMDECLKEVERNAGRIKAIKDGEMEPIYCRHCSYCHDTLPNDHVWSVDEFYSVDE